MNNKLFYRAYGLEDSIDEDARSVMISFSSETPAKRWIGDEYLLHGDENIDLERIRLFGSALLNHNENKIVGSLSDVRIDGRRGYAKLTFDTDELGEMAFSKVRSGSLRGVSVGYVIEEAVRVHEGETWKARSDLEIQGPAIVAKRWTPYEISLTPIPMDSTVGVGRSTRCLDGISIEELEKPATGLPKNHIFRKKLEIHGRFEKCL